MADEYIHGYQPSEQERLIDQGTTLAQLLHSDTAYPSGHRVLEAGCGVGAQTVTLASNSPGARITSIDISAASLAQARQRVVAQGLTNINFLQADVFHLPFPPKSFDHVFVCFVLEHLRCPLDALRALRSMLRDGGTLTVIEGDHGSTFFYPDSTLARRAVDCLVTLQARAGGDSLIGRALYPLLTEAGFETVQVSPRFVYADASRPQMVDWFTRKTFTAMIEGVREQVVASRLMSTTDFDQGIADLYRTAEPDGVFCYTFFKAVGVAQRQS